LITRNRPSLEGAALGAQLARLTVSSIDVFRRRHGEPPEMCRSCAFRAGTVPNRCLPTVGDALKCVMEIEPFSCHEGLDDDGEPTRLCQGWAIAVLALPEGVRPHEMPWDYSTDTDDSH
jgi:hypothetical protein